MKSLLLITTACICLSPATLHAQALASAHGLPKIPQSSEQRLGRQVELIVDDTGAGLAAGAFELAVDPRGHTMIYFPEDIEHANMTLPTRYFQIDVAKRRAMIYPRKRRLPPDVRRTLTLASASIATSFVITPAAEPSQAVSLITVRKRSEKEALEAERKAMRAAIQAESEQRYRERHRELDREVEQRAEETALERYLEHGTLVRPTLVQGDVEPHAPGTPAVTLSDFEAMWWGPDDMLVSFVVHNTGETTFDWSEARVFGPDRRAGRVSAAHVQTPAIQAEGLVGRLPGGKRARGAVLVERAKALTGPMTLMLGEIGGSRPLVATVGNWMPLQTEQALPGWEIRPAQPPDPEKGKVSLHLQGVYGAIWLGDGAGLDQTDATSLTGLGVRAQYAFNRYIAFEGEAMGASTGEAHFDDVAYEGMQGDLARSASLGRVQLGGVLRLGGDRYVPTARLGVGLQGAGLSGTLTTATGEAPGPDAFEFDLLWYAGIGVDARFGPLVAGLSVSGAKGEGRSIEAGLHLGYAWNP